MTNCIILSACGGKEITASAKAVSVGKQALKTVDEYLDGDLSYDDAAKKINELEDEMGYLDAQDTSEETYHEDYMISGYIKIIDSSLRYENFTKDSADYDQLIEDRNKLAETMGEEER